MGNAMRRLNHIVAAGVLACLALPLSASDAQITSERDEELRTMLDELADPDLERWQRLERRIVRIWSQSGSATADLLLQRGRDALRTGDARAAIEHLTALVDHAPDFAEGWNTRATAFFMANQYGPAMADIQQTLRLNPDHFGALSGMGIMLEELKLSEQALNAYRAANAIHPHRPDILRALERLEVSLEGRPL